jgi:glycosyltransferase involved in cell wall biosynthesis
VAGPWSKYVWPTLDVHDPEQLNTFLKRHGVPALTCDPAAAGTDEAGAIRFALALLQQRPDLRARFPRALLGGLDGEFCGWLSAEGANELGLPSAAVENLRRAFSRNLGYPVRKVYEFDRTISRRFPLALTPEQRRAFGNWLFRVGRSKFALTSEEILWFLFEAAEDACHGLARAYQRHAHWQRRFPLGITVFGSEDLRRWVGHHYGVFAPWLAEAELTGVLSPIDELRLLHAHDPSFRAVAPRAFQDPRDTARLVEAVREQRSRFSGLDDRWFATLASELAEGRGAGLGLNLVGHFCFPSGLREALLGVERALHGAGVRTARRDIPIPAVVRSEGNARSRYLEVELYDVTLVAGSTMFAPDAHFRDAGLAPRPSVYRIGNWYWELETVPPQFVVHARQLDEVWAPSRFIAQALQPVLPVPVIDLHPGVRIPDPADLGRAHFGLDATQFLFAFAFDLASTLDRKNPLGLIRAFRRAFGPDEPVALVIKVSHGELYPEDRQKLLRAAQDAGVTVIDAVLPRDTSFALLNVCDCYVSLHRSEGFGLSLAEAMLLGKPVIATGYSGNLDFMGPDNSLLVDYRLVPIGRDVRTYAIPGGTWAEPSTEHAARHMRWVYENRPAARALAERGRASATEVLSVAAASQRLHERLAAIRANRYPGVH